MSRSWVECFLEVILRIKHLKCTYGKLQSEGLHWLFCRKSQERGKAETCLWGQAFIVCQVLNSLWTDQQYLKEMLQIWLWTHTQSCHWSGWTCLCVAWYTHLFIAECPQAWSDVISCHVSLFSINYFVKDWLMAAQVTFLAVKLSLMFSMKKEEPLFLLVK